jgi:hypothetical protein
VMKQIKVDLKKPPRLCHCCKQDNMHAKMKVAKVCRECAHYHKVLFNTWNNNLKRRKKMVGVEL